MLNFLGVVFLKNGLKKTREEGERREGRRVGKRGEDMREFR